MAVGGPIEDETPDARALVAPTGVRSTPLHAGGTVDDLGASQAWADAHGNGARRIQKVSEIIAMRLVSEIVDRNLQPGDRMPLEAEMVEAYQVSRASLREALRLLEVQGLITLRPGRNGGPVVGTVNPEFLARTATLYFSFAGTTFDDLFTAHLLLEIEAARLAAANPDRDTVRRELAPLLDAVPPDDAHERHADYRSFHQTIRRLGGNQVLTLVADAISHIVTTHVLASMEPTQMRDQIDAEHRELARLVSDGDVEGAGALMQHHFESLLAYYRGQWPQRLEQPVEWR